MSLITIIARIKATTTWVIRGVVVFFIYLAFKSFLPHHLVPSTTVALIEPSVGKNAVDASFARVAFEIAFESLNQEAGLLQGKVDVFEVGKEIESEADAANIRKQLIDNDVEAIFGCATSACVRLIVPIADELEIPFFYVRPHEGLISSRYAFFLGPLPNQGIVPAIRWAMERYGSRVHITGSNGLYSRILGGMVRHEVVAAGGSITGEHYYGADEDTISGLPEAWNTDTTDLVINLAVNNTLISLMKLESVVVAGLRRPPQILASLDAALIADVGRYTVVDHYIIASYLQEFEAGLTGEFNQLWISRMGASVPFGVAEVSAFLAVRLWSTALRKTLTRDPVDVVNMLSNVHVDTGGAFGKVSFERNHHYLDHRLFVLKILDGDEFKLVSSGREPVKPVVYPVSNPKQYWIELLEQLRRDTADTWVFENTAVVKPAGSRG